MCILINRNKSNTGQKGEIMKDFNKEEKDREIKNKGKRTKKIRHKISQMAQKLKLFLKNHFPKRIWNKAQEKNKGRKF